MRECCDVVIVGGGPAGSVLANRFSGAVLQALAYPDLMFRFLPLAVRYDGSAPAGGHG